MRIITLIILFLGSILDNLLLIGSTIFDTLNFTNLMVFHTITVTLIFVYYFYIAGEKIQLPFYIALFIPGFGLIFLFFLYLSLTLFDKRSDLIEDYEKYIEYINEVVLEKQIDVQKEINVTPAFVNLAVASNEKKKNVIIDLISDDIDVKVHILRKALKDNDPEVVHYASSTLNLIENEYEKRINALRDAYISKGSKEILRELIDVHNKYIKFGLLSEEFLKFQLKEHLEIIEEYISKFTPDYGLLIKKVDILINLEEYDKACEILRNLYAKYPENIMNYIYTMKILFNQRKYKEVAKVAKKIKELNLIVPEKYKSIIEFWR